jgi:hypothetical protein
MNNVKITAIRNASVDYTYSMSIEGLPVFYTHLYSPEYEEVVAEFQDDLFQGTRGHNTNVTHRQFSGGGILPIIGQNSGGIGSFYSDNWGPTRNVYGYLVSQIFEISASAAEHHCWEYHLEVGDELSPRPGYFRASGKVACQRDFYFDKRRQCWRAASCRSYKVQSNDSFDVALSNMWASNPSDERLANTKLRGASCGPDYHWDRDLFDKLWLSTHTGPYRVLTEEVQADAFIKACEEFPIQCDNQISNMLDILEMMRALLDPTEVVTSMLSSLDSLKSLWMWWRYGYTTAMSDIRQAIDYAYRKKLSIWDFHRYDGHSMKEVMFPNGEHTTVACHCGFKTRIRADKLYSNTSWSRGVELNPYVIWDMIPLSFVVDWFSGTGDRLKYHNDLKHFLSDYDYSEMFYRTTYSAEVESHTHVKAKTYTREYHGAPSILRGSYIPAGRDASYVTQIKRGIDVLSLVQIK